LLLVILKTGHLSSLEEEGFDCFLTALSISDIRWFVVQIIVAVATIALAMDVTDVMDTWGGL
jgi:hypothetical protein